MSRNAKAQLEAYLTVAQAAQQLSVHQSTIRRWIEQGRLPAYRIGEKRIGVRSADLARLVTPRLGRRGQDKPVAQTERLMIPRMTKEEQQRGLQALEELGRLRDELAAKYGQVTPEGWELINQARDERTRELMRAVEE